jgi:hypothetical protein
MSIPVPLRTDFDAVALRRAAKATKDAAQGRRLLALAEIYDGGTRMRPGSAGSGSPPLGVMTTTSDRSPCETRRPGREPLRAALPTCGPSQVRRRHAETPVRAWSRPPSVGNLL